MRTIKVVGLTGQTGAGKSSVSRILRAQNMASIDCDEVARYVVDNEKKCLADLALEFGITILYADGTLNRRRLGAAVFGEPAKLSRLNGLIFPYIREEIGRRIDQLQEQGAQLVLLDAPTLFEAGADADCDYIVSVIAPEDERLNRIVVRDHLTDDQARKRIASQHGDAFYAERSQFVLRNDGSSAELHVKTLELIEAMRRALALPAGAAVE